MEGCKRLDPIVYRGMYIFISRGLHTPPPRAGWRYETADLDKLVSSTQVVELIHLLTLIDGPLTVSHPHLVMVIKFLFFTMMYNHTKNKLHK